MKIFFIPINFYLRIVKFSNIELVLLETTGTYLQWWICALSEVPHPQSLSVSEQKILA